MVCVCQTQEIHSFSPRYEQKVKADGCKSTFNVLVNIVSLSILRFLQSKPLDCHLNRKYVYTIQYDGQYFMCFEIRDI